MEKLKVDQKRRIDSLDDQEWSNYDLNGITTYKEYGYYKNQVTDPKWHVNVINKMLLVMTTVKDYSIVQIVILLLICCRFLT